MYTLSDGTGVPVFDNHTHIGPGPLIARTTNIASGVLDGENMVRLMDAAGIDMACCFATANPHTDYSVINWQVVEWARQYPDRIIPYARLHPHFGAAHNRALLREYAQAGVRGLKLHSLLDGAFPNNDKRLIHPLMEVAEEERLLVIFHCGETWSATPALVVDLAMDFPNVNFVIGHMGLYGFHTEALAFAPRVPNVYLDTTELYPSWWVSEAVRVVGSKRVLYGSDAPYNPFGEELEKVTKWSTTPEDSLADILGGNLARLLRMEEVYSQLAKAGATPVSTG
jgi:predicted TIM-barrel fold metal-dependent hydrolase